MHCPLFGTGPSTAKTYSLSLHDALPISAADPGHRTALTSVMAGVVSIPEVDRIAITTVVDNSIDNLRADEKVARRRSEEHTSELQSLRHLVCRLPLEKKKHEDHHREEEQ